MLWVSGLLRSRPSCEPPFRVPPAGGNLMVDHGLNWRHCLFLGCLLAGRGPWALTNCLGQQLHPVGPTHARSALCADLAAVIRFPSLTRAQARRSVAVLDAAAASGSVVKMLDHVTHLTQGIIFHALVGLCVCVCV